MSSGNAKKERGSGARELGSQEPGAQEAGSQDARDLEIAIDQAIAASGGDLRTAIGALIVANAYLESEVEELMKAVSRAFLRGRFETYTG